MVRPCSVLGLLQRIGELERDLGRLQGEIQKCCAEQESARNQLAQKAKVTWASGGVESHGWMMAQGPDPGELQH